jgi:hypothetical protein
MMMLTSLSLPSGSVARGGFSKGGGFGTLRLLYDSDRLTRIVPDPTITRQAFQSFDLRAMSLIIFSLPWCIVLYEYFQVNQLGARCDNCPKRL